MIFVLCVFEFESVSVRESYCYNVIWKLIFLLVFVRYLILQHLLKSIWFSLMVIFTITCFVCSDDVLVSIMYI